MLCNKQWSSIQLQRQIKPYHLKEMDGISDHAKWNNISWEKQGYMPSLLCVISGKGGIKIKTELLGKKKEVKEMGGNRGINDQSMLYAWLTSRECIWRITRGFGNLQAHPYWYIFSHKATHPNPFQAVLLMGTEYLNIWSYGDLSHSNRHINFQRMLLFHTL